MSPLQVAVLPLSLIWPDGPSWCTVNDPYGLDLSIARLVVETTSGP